MVRGAIVGPHSDALAWFVGVFYAAQVRRTTDGADPYRFSCSTEALQALGGLYNALKGGELPPTPAPDSLGRIAFSMDYPDALGKRILPAFGRARKERGAPELELGVAPLVKPPGKTEFAPDDQAAGALVDAQVFVALAAIPSLDAQGALPVDGAIASLLNNARRANPTVTVVWWLPGPPEAPKPKDGEEAPPAIPPPRDAGARRDLTNGLMQRHLPLTAAAAGKHAPSTFFAWLATETKTGAIRVKRRQLFDVGGVEPEYPYEESLALLDHLGAISV